MLTLTREQEVASRLLEMRRTSTLQEGFRAVNDLTIELLAEIACEGTDSVDEAITKAESYINAAKSVSRMVPSRARNSVWANTLMVLVSQPEHKEVIDSFTVDGEVLIELVSAIYGN